jgi:hypothetical protein
MSNFTKEELQLILDMMYELFGRLVELDEIYELQEKIIKEIKSIDRWKKTEDYFANLKIIRTEF